MTSLEEIGNLNMKFIEKIKYLACTFNFTFVPVKSSQYTTDQYNGKAIFLKELKRKQIINLISQGIGRRKCF